VGGLADVVDERPHARAASSTVREMESLTLRIRRVLSAICSPEASIRLLTSLLRWRYAARGLAPRPRRQRSRALLASAGSLHGCVQRQDVGLERDALDDLHDVGNASRRGFDAARPRSPG
jgi:hypothetical protein